MTSPNTPPTTPQIPIVQGPPASVVAAPYDYKTLDQLDPDESIRALLFAPPKHGKTTLVGTFPAVAFVDFDGEGVKSLTNKYFIQKYGLRMDHRFKTFTPEFDEFGLPKDAKAFWDALAWINKVINDPAVKTICIDGITSMSRVASIAGIIASAPKKRSTTWNDRIVNHMLLLTQSDFGAEMSAIEQLLDQLMKIRHKHIIVTAHQREKTSESGTLIETSPLVTGDRLRAKIAGWFDDVWYLDTDSQGKRILKCQPQGTLKSVGSRLGLPKTIDDPTFDKIIAAMKS